MLLFVEKWVHLWDTSINTTQIKQLPKFNQIFKSKYTRFIFYFITISIGITGAAIVFRLFPERGIFGIHHRIIIWQWQYILYALVPLIASSIFGIFFLVTQKISNTLSAKFNKSVILKASLWGLILALLSLITKYAMFSGEVQIVPFVQQALQINPFILLIIGIVKVLSTNIGFSMGWRGGKIFPSIFASVAIGAAISAFLPIMPVICVAITVSSSIAIILDKPLLMAIFINSFNSN